MADLSKVGGARDRQAVRPAHLLASLDAGYRAAIADIDAEQAEL